jgi:hypothetical protein
LYTFIAIIFLAVLWVYVQKSESMYAYYSSILMALFVVSLLTCVMNVIVIVFSLYDLFIQKQARSLGYILLQLLSAAAAASVGVYAAILQIGY